MQMISDLKADRTRCKSCGYLLYQRLGSKRTRRTLREFDGEVILAVIIDIHCNHCSGVNEIFYQADMISAVSAPAQKRNFACVQTL